MPPYDLVFQQCQHHLRGVSALGAFSTSCLRDIQSVSNMEAEESTDAAVETERDMPNKPIGLELGELGKKSLHRWGE